MNAIYSFLKNTFVVPMQRYSISDKEERTDAIRATIFIAFIHVLIAFWLFVFTGRIVPEHIFLAFSGIVLGGMGFDSWKSNTITINNKEHSGSNPDIDNPDE